MLETFALILKLIARIKQLKRKVKKMQEEIDRISQELNTARTDLALVIAGKDKQIADLKAQLAAGGVKTTDLATNADGLVSDINALKPPAPAEPAPTP
jgi:septal ring factor EnvC (AmiA/AmiB activator)